MTLLEIISFAKSTLNVVDSIVASIPGLKSVTTGAMLALQSVGQTAAKSLADSLANKGKKSVNEFKDSVQNTTTVVDDFKTSFQEFSKASDLKNDSVLKKMQEDADAFNASIAESKRLMDGIESGSQSIAERLGRGVVDMNLDLGGPPVVEIPEIDDSKKTAFLLKLQEFKDQANSIISSAAVEGIAGLAAGLGQALASGANIMQSLGTVLLGTIGSIMTQLGKAAIGIGIGMEAIKKAFTNPFTAIAAGIALIALGSYISTKVSKMTSGGGGGSGGGALGPATSLPARAMGGSVQMGQPYLVGERGPELFTPSGFGSITNARSTAGMGMGGQTIHITGTLVGEGRQLKAVFDDYVRTTGRTT
jgi:hypothetical protein